MDESKHRRLLLEQVNEKDIIDEESWNNRYVALTNDSVYFVSIGILSGHFFGKKIKTFPIDKITSVDIGKKILASYMEITAAGMGGSSYSKARYTENNENLVFFPNTKLKRFQEKGHIYKNFRDSRLRSIQHQMHLMKKKDKSKELLE